MNPHDQESPAEPASQAMRTTVSLLLFGHLFVLLITLSCYDRTSNLQHRLRKLFAPYVERLNFDLAGRDVASELVGEGGAYVPRRLSNARYHLTYGGELDTDFTLEFTIEGQTEPVVLPPPGAQWGPNYRRYLALVALTAEWAADEDSGSHLPVALGGAIMADHDARDARIRVRQHRLQEISAVDSRRPQERDPMSDAYYQTTMEGHLIKIGPRVSYLPVVTAAEAARAAPTDGERDTTNPPSSRRPSSPSQRPQF